MAKRRCFSIDLFNSENFLNLTNDAKALYLGLLLHADDDGVVINPRTVLRLMEIRSDVLDELYLNGFLIDVDGICIIKHWLFHNKIQPSRKVDSLYQAELSKLYVTQTKEYALKKQCV